MNMRFLISGCCAIGVEIFLVYCLFFSILPKPSKQYVFEKKTEMDFIQIDQVVEKIKQEIPKKAQQMPQQAQSKKQEDKKQEVKKSEKKASPKPSQTIGSDVKKLFEKIDSSNPPIREERIEDERAMFSANAIKKKEYLYEQNNVDIQQETSKIQDMLDAIWEKELEVSTPKMQDISQGEYDEWFAKIKSILYSKWTNSFYESVAIRVNIIIRSDGSFSYHIIENSKNQSYNAYMKEMLESLKSEKFPPYPKKEIISLEVIFKTKEHDNE